MDKKVQMKWNEKNREEEQVSRMRLIGTDGETWRQYHRGGAIEEQGPQDTWKTTHFIKPSSRLQSSIFVYVILVITFKMK